MSNRITIDGVRYVKEDNYHIKEAKNEVLKDVISFVESEIERLNGYSKDMENNGFTINQIESEGGSRALTIILNGLQYKKY